MDIKQLMEQMHYAKNEHDKKHVENIIKLQFSLLSDEEQKAVKKEFLEGLDMKLNEADRLINKIDIALEIEEISKYISLSKISKDYFGHSKEWIYQRIKGYNVNGKPAQFTPEERKKLSSALEEISRMAHETSLKIA